MGNFEHVRKIYQKALELFYEDENLWIKFANFEEEIEEIERSRNIY